MNAIVDQDGCIGCGLCAATAPSVFRMNDNGVAECYKEVSEEDRGVVQEAIDECPVSVIDWDE